MQSTIKIPVLAISLALLCGPLFAQDAPLPTATDPHGTPYISGGVGDAELQQVKAASKSFNLKLILAEKSGSFAADVAIAVFDRKGNTVLEVPAAGPLLLAKLAPGTYRISATYEGHRIEKRVTVPAQGQTSASYYW